MPQMMVEEEQEKEEEAVSLRRIAERSSEKNRNLSRSLAAVAVAAEKNLSSL
jgi:hypothetical protein